MSPYDLKDEEAPVQQDSGEQGQVTDEDLELLNKAAMMTQGGMPQQASLPQVPMQQEIANQVPEFDMGTLSKLIKPETQELDLNKLLSMGPSGLDDAALQQAQQDRRAKEQGLNLNRAGEQILQGAVEMGGGNYTPNYEVLNALEKSAQRPVTDLQERQKLYGAQLDTGKELFKLKNEMEDEGALKDPNSTVSQVYRATAKELGKSIGLDIPDNATAKSLEKVLPVLKVRVSEAVSKFQKGGTSEQGTALVFDPQSGQFKDTGVKLASELFQVADPLTGARTLVNRRTGEAKKTYGAPEERTGEEKSSTELFKTLDAQQRKKLDSFRTDFLKDTDKDRDAVFAAQGIRNMLVAGKEINGDVIRAVQNQFARASGEKGAMTERDVSAFGGRADILSRLGRYLKVNAVGELPEADRRFLTDLSNVMERSAKSYVDKKGNFFVNNLSNDISVKKPDAVKLLGIDAVTGNTGVSPVANVPKDKVLMVNPQGKKGYVPKAQVEAAIKQGFKQAE